jgi:hypothetical protein
MDGQLHALAALSSVYSVQGNAKKKESGYRPEPAYFRIETKVYQSIYTSTPPYAFMA